MSDRPTRVGIIGAGGWAKCGHIPALRLRDKLEVTAVSARTSESAERRAGIAHAYDDPQALVDDPGVELVSS